MNNFIKIIIVILVSSHSYSQECVLQKNNAAYLLKFDSINNFRDKIILIREKLNFDRLFVPDTLETGCNIAGNKFTYKLLANKWKNILEENCGKKILHFVFYKGGKEIIELDEYFYPENSQILDKLSEENVAKIEEYNEDVSRVLFGERGNATKSIVIYTNDRNIKKLIKKLRKIKNVG